jgi:hypothetical protein
MLEQYYTVFELFVANRLPCFVKVLNSGKSEPDIIYLDKIIKSDCAFAREYHTLETAHHGGASDIDDQTWSHASSVYDESMMDSDGACLSRTKDSESIEFDDCIIPAGYEGMRHFDSRPF